ncbi:integral membrane protein GPR155 [Galendromus occidentalis]|uniref:Integral membrane protein GPR155 n=1 Tax=Galendromus occidentalis TaxID=34638 RepID=A0AAJ6QV94_9ACAR|nr:integral membrane protein GPR155 [Galendromus occidentalis]
MWAPDLNTDLEEGDDRMAVVHNTSVTLLQCVLITVAGYVSSRFGLFTEDHIRGIELFTSNLALPALMFEKISSLSLRNAHGDLILGIFLAKLVVLCSVVLIGYCFSHKSWNIIGLYGIFATMCNDFGIALPVLQALYGAKLADELYLIAPLSLCLLNPVCLYMMETHAQTTSEENLLLEPSTSGKGRAKSGSRCTLLLGVVLRTLFHPHVIICLLGIAFNMSGWTNSIPEFVRSSLDVIGNSFAALILFLLGFRLNPKCVKPTYKLSVIALSVVKTLALPILCLIGVRLVSDSVSLSNFAFIYGAVPTPPLVTVYASQYDVNPQQISTAVCISSIMSLPLLFVASKSTALNMVQPDLSDYQELGRDLTPGVIALAVVNFLCCVLVIIYLTLISSRFERLPFHFVLCICISQIFQSLGMIFWHFPQVVLNVYAVCFITASQMSCRLFLAFFAISLSSLNEGDRFEKYKRRLTLFGFVASAVTTLLMYWTSGRDVMTSSNLPLFLNGQIEAIIFTIVLSFSLCASFGALLDALFRETGLSSPLRGNTESSKPSRHLQKHLLCLIGLSGSALVGLIHTYWRISDSSDRPLLIAIEYLDCYMAFSQALIILLAYGIHSKYYNRAERLLYAYFSHQVSRILSAWKNSSLFMISSSFSPAHNIIGCVTVKSTACVAPLSPA